MPSPLFKSYIPGMFFTAKHGSTLSDVKARAAAAAESGILISITYYIFYHCLIAHGRACFLWTEINNFRMMYGPVVPKDASQWHCLPLTLTHHVYTSYVRGVQRRLDLLIVVPVW